MAYRFTNTDKWSDSWFSELNPLEKLVFAYLCDKCDIAGFIEFTPRVWAVELGCSVEEINEAIKPHASPTLGAREGLGRGLIYSLDNSCFFVKNFLKHQKNLPIKSNNNAHIGIVKRIELYCEKFGFTSSESFIDELIQRGYQGAREGLASPIGKGTGKGSGKGNDNGSEKGNDPYYAKFNFAFVEEWAKDAFRLWLQYKFDREEPLTTQIAIEKNYAELSRLTVRDKKKADELINYLITKQKRDIYEMPEQKTKATNIDNLPKAKTQKQLDDEWRQEIQSREQARSI